MNWILSFYLLLALLPNPALPELSEGQQILADGKPIDIDIGHLVPVAIDWNSDGKKDLLVGQFLDGKIRFYPNKGTDEKPLFAGFEYLQAGGKIISLPTG